MQFFLLIQPKSDSIEDRAGGMDVMSEENCNLGPAPRCPRCNRPLGMKTWQPPYRLEIETWGKHYGDIARTGDDLIVSERFKDYFERAGLKGIETFEPVEVIKVVHRRGKPQEPIPLYFKASVVRNSAIIDQKASEYEWEDESKVCPECLFDTLKRNRRLVIKQETWNGDDSFFPRGGDGPIVSERFRSICEEHQLLGAIFIPSDSEDAGYDSFPWEVKAK